MAPDTTARPGATRSGHLRARLGVIVALFSPSTVAALGGLALLSFGLWGIYQPLAFVIPGAAFTAFGLWLAGMFTSTGGSR